MRIRHRIDDRQARGAFTRSPAVMVLQVSNQLKAGAELIGGAAKLNASQRTIFDTLTNSIVVERVSALHYQVIAGANHARPVEEGSGPAAGQSRYFPNVQSLEQYIRHSRSMRGFKNWSRSARVRRSQEREIRDRAWGLAWHILERGTKAYPFMAPAVAENRSELHRMIERGVQAGIAQVFGQ